jgi:hypothetical protein
MFSKKVNKKEEKNEKLLAEVNDKHIIRIGELSLKGKQSIYAIVR